MTSDTDKKMDLEAEKVSAQEVERTLEEEENDARIAAFTPEEQRMIIRRIDLRLVTTLGVLYTCSLMDRTNLGAANIAGMAKDLHMAGVRYSIVVLTFFIPYVLFQPPATVVLRKIGPTRFLASITFLWGVCTMCFGFLKKWDQMIALRVVLGILESGFFPGCVYLLSTWYTRYELQKRNAAFYLIGSLISALAGILAYGIMQMNGIGGLAGWRWIFIMEGIITCVAAGFGYFLIVDFPEFAAKSFHFLNEKEAAFIVARIERDRADAIPEPFSLAKYIKAGMDLKVWAFASLFGLTTISTYAIAYFLPVILRTGMGFDIAASQCLGAPPAFAAAIMMYCQAILGDRWHLRGPIIVFNALLAIMGLLILGYAKGPGVRYFGVFVATMACNANVPAILTYQANNIRGQWKRALCSATLVGFGGIGGIIGSTIFRDKDAPKYRPGIWATMIGNSLVIVIVGLLTIKFWGANKRAERGGKVIEGQVGFRYTL